MEVEAEIVAQVGEFLVADGLFERFVEFETALDGDLAQSGFGGIGARRKQHSARAKGAQDCESGTQALGRDAFAVGELVLQYYNSFGQEIGTAGGESIEGVLAAAVHGRHEGGMLGLPAMDGAAMDIDTDGDVGDGHAGAEEVEDLGLDRHEVPPFGEKARDMRGLGVGLAE